MTSPRPTKHATSKAAKIRKLILQGMPTKDIGLAVKVPMNRVYNIRSVLKKQGRLPGATGIATLSIGLPEYRDTSDIKQNADLIYRITQGRVEAAHAASEVEDGAIEKKHRKETMVYIAVFAIFAAALAIYIFAR